MDSQRLAIYAYLKSRESHTNKPSKKQRGKKQRGTKKTPRGSASEIGRAHV